MIHKVCEKCKTPFQTNSPASRWCSDACRSKTCKTCGVVFVPTSPTSIYCSRACVPCHGESNPNYGKRHPGMFHHSTELRGHLSKSRMGSNNPNWKGGGKNVGKCRHQSYARIWALQNISDTCEVCGADSNLEVHHIVSRKLFADPKLANFRDNLMVLCKKHHRQADGNQHTQKSKRDTPFLNRLPESILDQLKQDGLVSRLPADIVLIQFESPIELAYRYHQATDDKSA